MRHLTLPGLKSWGSLLSVAALVAAGDARADWPMSRHDAKRTGVAAGKSNITKPVVAWSAYLGGSLAATSMIAHDVDGDGVGDVVYLNGGVVSAKHADDTLIWATRVLSAGSLGGIEDLDGDGKLEVIVNTQHGAWVLDLATGAVRWQQPQGEMGAVSNLRIADVTGDGLADVVITECGGCGGSKPQRGFVYSFAAGFGAPHRTELDPIQGAGPAVTVVKVDPNLPARLLMDQDSSTLALLDGVTGKTIALSPSVGGQLAWSTSCLPGDIDGIPGDELICVASDGLAPTPVTPDERKVFALKLNPVGPPSLDLLWVYSAPVGEAISNNFNAPILDLDADGKPEVILSTYHADGTFSTHLLSGATGAEITKIDGERYVGSGPFESPKALTILTFAGTHTTAWAYDGVKKKLVLRWQVDDRYPVPEPYLAHTRISTAEMTKPVTIDLDSDGILDLVMVKLSPGAQVDGYVTSPGPASVIDYASFALPEGLQQGGVWSAPAVGPGLSRVAVAESDGTLHLLDHQLKSTAAQVRFGGYYASGGWEELGKAPVVASVGSAAQAIFASDSRGRVVRLDAEKATKDTPPVEVWSLHNAFSPIVLPGLLGGKPGVAALYRDQQVSPPASAVIALDPANGSLAWKTPLPDTPWNDLLSGDFDLDGIPDLAVQWSVGGSDTLTTAALSGANGKQLWSFDAAASGCGLQSAGFSIADWNGDGVDDVIQVRSQVRVDSGKDGSSIAKSDASFCYFLPTPLDTNNDGVDELLLHGGFVPVEVVGHDLKTPVYQSTDDDRPYPYGAVATCPGGPVLIEGSWLSVGRLKLTRLATGTFTTMVLASGKVYPDETAALAANAGFGQLTSASVHADLEGEGRPIVAVGSADGFLYGLDPCTGDLAFTHDFGFAVGEVVFGDSDGDGLDEILVSVADGNLYDLKNDPGTIGTGGAGGSTSASTGATTGAGGSGGDAPTPALKHYPLYGRAGCYCAVPTGPAHDEPAIFVLAGALVVAARRLRRRDR